MNFLDEILNRKRQAVAELLQARSENSVRENALKVRRSAQPHRLRATLREEKPEIKIIAEYKRKSPSRGVIRQDLGAAEVASLYEKAGACAISVLTEANFFDGSIDDLHAVRAATQLPLLQKDFIFHPVQVFAAAEAGADVILLIAAALSAPVLSKLRAIAEEELALDALVEVHTETEMSSALNCGAQLIGINNRSLTTFEVSLSTSERLIDRAPQNAQVISESGFRTTEELRRFHRLGFCGFLIGESLMRAENPGDALRALLQADRHAN